jgi:nitrilase
MPERIVKVAAIQATPEILDKDASIAKAVRLVHEAADMGAQLAVMPEVFVSVYPSNAWAKQASDFGGWDTFWERFLESSVAVPGTDLDPIAEACAERSIVLALGVNERDDSRPGTVFNTLVYIDERGLIGKHRKLMPTHHERLFHGIGAGDDLAAVDTAAGRVGGLICWENRMPLARYEVYKSGPEIWVAPTADDTDGWLATMRHIAIESSAFVIAVPQYIPRSAFPDDFPVPLPEGKDVFGNGGAVIVEAGSGKVLAGPVYGKEEIITADIDLNRCLHARRIFDAAGHYSRSDVFGA